MSYGLNYSFVRVKSNLTHVYTCELNDGWVMAMNLFHIDAAISFAEPFGHFLQGTKLPFVIFNSGGRGWSRDLRLVSIDSNNTL